jgi:hypothetical protein
MLARAPEILSVLVKQNVPGTISPGHASKVNPNIGRIVVPSALVTRGPNTVKPRLVIHPLLRTLLLAVELVPTVVLTPDACAAPEPVKVV